MEVASVMGGALSEFLGRVRTRRVCVLVGLVFAALPVGSALAQSPSVFAGYASGIQTDPSSHPSPWQGAAGVDFVGCNYFTPGLCPQDGKVYDAGALMLANESNRAVTVTDASVTIGKCTLEPWLGLQVIVNPGKKLILTQTGGAMPCGLRAGPDDNFDTSDLTEACINNGLIPEFHVTVNGTGLTYRDTRQILNTGGGNGPCHRGQEMHAWEPMSPAAVPAHPPSTTQKLSPSTTQTPAPSTTQTPAPSTTQTPAQGISPILSAFWASPTRLSLAGRLVGGRCVKPTRKNLTHKKCTRPIALEFHYALNTAATVMFTLTRGDPGRKVLGRCLEVTSKNRRHPPCTRPTRLPGALIHASTAGSNSFTFQGRIGGTSLGPGTYRLTAAASPSGSPRRPQTVTVKVVG
jgi:hypothetical protein